MIVDPGGSLHEYRNLNQLREWKVRVIEPVEKVLACGDVGKGALPPVDSVVEYILNTLRSQSNEFDL